MQLASVRLVTTDVDALAASYERLTGVSPARPNPALANFSFGAMALAISSEGLVNQFNAGAAVAASNRSAMIEFEVEDVDATRAGLGTDVAIVMEPANMPWGNRSMLARHPDGNVINLFRRLRGQVGSGA